MGHGSRCQADEVRAKSEKVERNEEARIHSKEAQLQAQARGVDATPARPAAMTNRAKDRRIMTTSKPLSELID